MISVRSEVQILPGPPLSAKLKVVAATAVLQIPRERPGAGGDSGQRRGASCAVRLSRYLRYRWRRRALTSLARGCSSVGRAPALQAGGHRFDSVHLHHFERTKPQNEEGSFRLIRVPERSQVSRAAYFWSFDLRGCSLFNNSEEASASISQGRCTGCDCIDWIPSKSGGIRHKRENSCSRDFGFARGSKVIGSSE